VREKFIIHKFLHCHWLSSTNHQHNLPSKSLPAPPVLHPLVLSRRHLPQHIIPYCEAELDKSYISKSSKRYKLSQVHRDSNQHRRRSDGRLEKIERMNGVKRKSANGWMRRVPRKLRDRTHSSRALVPANVNADSNADAPNPPSSTSAKILTQFTHCRRL
jgi:hypothetical protein